MLRIHLDHLKEKSLSLDMAVPAERFPILRRMMQAGECGFAGPISIRLKAIRIGELVEVDGECDASLRLTCGRCLREFTSPVQFVFALTYAPEPSAAAVERSVPLRPGDEDAGLLGFHGDTIDLHEGIQEQIILSLPLRPLCAESCRGLCARCGADLNEGPCGCRPSDADSAFALLRHLK
jgi:uncharacterized protein